MKENLFIEDIPIIIESDQGNDGGRGFGNDICGIYLKIDNIKIFFKYKNAKLFIELLTKHLNSIKDPDR
jgi:hypothetical protein